jgi:(p)ppGpp synthase/HD superfamily hydrolase
VGAGDGAPSLSFARDLPLTQRALQFATERHGEQRREADHAPFMVHPVEVAALLERARYPDHVVAAAVLHDVLEDTDAKRSELEESFGAEVADLVATVSDDPTIPDEEARKDHVREEVRRKGGYAAVVYAADKISKVRELRTQMATGVNREDIEPRIRRHRRSLEMLEETMPGSVLVEDLRFELETLEQLPPTA